MLSLQREIQFLCVVSSVASKSFIDALTLCVRFIFWGFTIHEIDWLTRHDRRNRVFIDELGMPVPPQQDAEIIEPSYDTLQLDAVDKENCKRRLLLAYVV